MALHDDPQQGLGWRNVAFDAATADKVHFLFSAENYLSSDCVAPLAGACSQPEACGSIAAFGTWDACPFSAFLADFADDIGQGSRAASMILPNGAAIPDGHLAIFQYNLMPPPSSPPATCLVSKACSVAGD